MYRHLVLSKVPTFNWIGARKRKSCRTTTHSTSTSKTMFRFKEWDSLRTKATELSESSKFNPISSVWSTFHNKGALPDQVSLVKF